MVNRISTQPPSRLGIDGIRDNFEIHGLVRIVNGQEKNLIVVNTWLCYF